MHILHYILPLCLCHFLLFTMVLSSVKHTRCTHIPILPNKFSILPTINDLLPCPWR